MNMLGAGADEPRIEPTLWTFDPWQEHRGRALTAVLGSVGLIAIAAWLRLPLAILAALSLAVLALLAPGFLPTHCGVDSHGVSRRIGFMPASLRPWRSIHAAALSPRGLHVSTREWRAPLSALQQMSLPVPRGADDDALRVRLRSALSNHGF